MTPLPDPPATVDLTPLGGGTPTAPGTVDIPGSAPSPGAPATVPPYPPASVSSAERFVAQLLALPEELRNQVAEALGAGGGDLTGAVRYDQAQALEAGEATQARTNIGAAAAADLDSLADVVQEALTDVDDNAAKLASSPLFGELYRITGESARIERFVGGAIAGFSIPNVSTEFGSGEQPLRVISQPTAGSRAYFGQLGPSDYLYVDWDSNTPDAWTIQSADGAVWISYDDVDHPLDVTTWVKVWVEADEENPVFPPLPTLVAAPAANDTAWVVERNTVALTVDNALGTDVTINGVLCTNGEQTFVGWVDPTEISSSGATIYATAVESGSTYQSLQFNAPSGYPFAIPFAFGPRATATLYLYD